MEKLNKLHYVFALLGSMILCATFYIYNPNFSLQILILLVFAGLIGVPHGLTDFAILDRLPRRLGLKLRNYAYKCIGGFIYIVIALAFYGLWGLAPLLTLIIFLILSVWHFGHQDIESYLNTYKLLPFHAILRGSMIILLPLFAHEETGFYFNTLSESSLFSNLTMTSTQIVLLIIFYILTSLCLKLMLYVIETIVIISILILLPPLLSFTIYFCLWHTPRHYISEVKHMDKKVGIALGCLVFMTLIASVPSFFYIYPELDLRGYGLEIMEIFFKLLSSLTVSHVIFTHSQKAD
jgi:Brp/Blh family beta-carotene 15,15'-monooxygenase